MGISRKDMLMGLMHSAEQGRKLREGSEMARANEGFMDTIKNTAKAAYDTGKYMVTGELPGAKGMKPGDSLPSKEEQRKQQDATQSGFGGLEKTINATETGARVAKGAVDVGLQVAAPGVGGAIATGIDLASAGAAHAMGANDARDYALASAGANAIGAVAGGAGKLAANAAAKGASQVATNTASGAIGAMAKKGTETTIKDTMSRIGDSLSPKPRIAMESHAAHRGRVILETINSILFRN